MKKLGLLFLIAFIILLLATVFLNSMVRAEPSSESANSDRTFDQESGGTLDLRLTDSHAFTVYLPLALGPPPLNPKKGVGVVASPACDDLESVKASWYLNWGIYPDATCTAENKDKFVPRMYNGNSMLQLEVAIENAKASGWLIGFSEPNLPWQGNVTPTQGAIYWRQIEIAADAAGIKLVSPSPNQWEPGQNGQPYGHQWVWVMVDEYRARYGKSPRFDAMGWNIYKRTAGEIQAYLTTRRNEALARGYDVPIWLLEIGGRCVTGSAPEIQGTMTAITPWLDSTPWIERYAWFANRASVDGSGVDYSKCSLVDPNTNNLTQLGRIYSTY